jgi:hypothetical protein
MTSQIYGKSVDVIAPTTLYKWASVWGKIQKNYYTTEVYLRREKQIEDFAQLNEYKNLYVEKDTDVLKTIESVASPSQADLVIITDQKFSRLPCAGIVDRITQLLDQCPALLICINRHYINIDNTYQDSTLSNHYPLAVTQWLKKSLPTANVIDLSLDYLDHGDWFTWVIPDRIYYITRT